MAARIASFAEFWPFYLGEHRRPLTRAFHFAGTNAALVLAIAAALTGRPSLVVGALAVAYGLAWVSHFAIEKNRPATFRYPLWSFAGDWKMWALIWTGRLGRELSRIDSDGR
jgi:hypothetical protein